MESFSLRVFFFPSHCESKRTAFCLSTDYKSCLSSGNQGALAYFPKGSPYKPGPLYDQKLWISSLGLDNS